MPHILIDDLDDDVKELTYDNNPNHDLTSRPNNGGLPKRSYSTKPTAHRPRFSANGGDIASWKKNRK